MSVTISHTHAHAGSAARDNDGIQNTQRAVQDSKQSSARAQRARANSPSRDAQWAKGGADGSENIQQAVQDSKQSTQMVQFVKRTHIEGLRSTMSFSLEDGTNEHDLEAQIPLDRHRRAPRRSGGDSQVIAKGQSKSNPLSKRDQYKTIMIATIITVCAILLLMFCPTGTGYSPNDIFSSERRRLAGNEDGKEGSTSTLETVLLEEPNADPNGDIGSVVSVWSTVTEVESEISELEQILGLFTEYRDSYSLTSENFDEIHGIIRHTLYPEPTGSSKNPHDSHTIDPSQPWKAIEEQKHNRKRQRSSLRFQDSKTEDSDTATMEARFSTAGGSGRSLSRMC